jgi:hypothetical protein
MVKIDVSVNYKDAPYYRYEKSESIVERSMTIENFMKLDFDDYLKTITELMNTK